MALASSTFVITPNPIDGKQRLSDPTGVYVPPVETITPVTNLQVTENLYNSQTITWDHSGTGIDNYIVELWIAGEPGWVEVGTPAPGTKTWTTNGLPAETIIRHRVATTGSSQVSAWLEVDATTPASPVAGGDTDLTKITFFYNFEHLANGTSIYDAPEPFTTCRNFTCTTSRAYAGTRCGHTKLDTSDPRSSETNQINGYGYWGYALNNLPKPYHGCEMWWRKAIYWPTNAGYTTNVKFLKQQRKMRRVRGPSDANSGSTETSLSQDGTRRQLREAENCLDIPGTSSGIYRYGYPAVLPGKWTMIEAYTLFHVDSYTGISAAWVDGQPVGRFFSQTMAATDEWARYLYMGTYWNGGIERAGGFSEQFYDQIAVAIRGETNEGYIDDTPWLSRDSDGHLFIGMATNTDDLS